MLLSLRERFRLLVRSGRPSADIREEMLAHIALCTDENIAAGMDPETARREAERRFGDLERLVHEGHSAKRDRRDPLGRFPNRRHNSPGTDLMSDLLSDLRFGARMLVKSPMFSIVAILSLAVGIGFNATMFTVVDAVVFKPFPAADPDTVVRVRRAQEGVGSMHMSYPDFLDVRQSAGSFSGLAAARTEMGTFNHEGDVNFVFGESVSSEYFSVLGIPPLLGRTFAPGEDIPGNHFVAMVSEKFWRQRLGADPAALGRPLQFGGEAYTLVGVVPNRYRGIVPPLEIGFWVPAPATDALSPGNSTTSQLERRSSHGFYVVGRLRDGVTVQQAGDDVAAIGRQLARDFADTNADVAFEVLPAAGVRIDPSVDRMMLPAAGVLMALVGLVLLLACANVANMMLARGSVRRQEIGVRLALGARRGRLVRQLLTESMMLACVAGVLAVLIARAGVQLLLAIQPPLMVPVSLAVEVSPRVWLFTGLVALLTGLAFGLLPAIRSTRADLSQSIRGDEAGDGGRLRGSRLRGSLVVAQVTLSLVLLIAAALMVRSLQNAQSIDPGIMTDSVVNVSAGLVFQGYSAGEARAFHLQALDRFAALPGVTQVAFAERLPLESSVVTDRRVYVEGAEPAAEKEVPSSMTTSVDPRYFELMGIRIDQGRGFTEADVAEAPRVVIVNEVLASQFWPGEVAIGKRLSVAGPDGPFAEVVGIHSPHKISTLGEAPTFNVYVPYAQDDASGLGNMLARTEGDAAATLAAMRQVLREMDSGLAVMKMETIGQHLSLSLFPVRLAAAALGLLGMVGALLASVGVYAVVAFGVAQRTREIGIRMAIGADRARVVRMVVRQGMRLILVGAALGLAISLASTRVLSSLLYGVSATDVSAYAGAALALGLVGMLANLIPALRASRVNPTTALRSN